MAAPRAFTPAKEKQIAKSYAKGKSSTELAEKYGVHRSTIVGVVKRAKAENDDIEVEIRKAGGIKGTPRKR